MIKALPSAQRKNHEEREAEKKLADLSLSTSFGQHLLHACFTVRLRMTRIRRDHACVDDHDGEVCRHRRWQRLA